ncbi:hypothetical protein F5Y10DRAFT_288393 [Nemania abortiva]|nr:hypothetical protein F5Y10DRAFT_288393 [Nemania abortiva]
MENKQAESGASRPIVKNAGPSAREWTAEELECLQRTSKIIGVPFSKFMRFAETRCEDDGTFVGTHTAADGREWTAEELAMFQRAARVISVPLSSLLSFAEAALKSLPQHSQFSSTTRQNAETLPAPDDANSRSTFSIPLDSNEGRPDASVTVPVNEPVPFGVSYLFDTDPFLDDSNFPFYDDLISFNDQSVVPHYTSSTTGYATFSPPDLTKCIDQLDEELGHRVNSDAEPSSSREIANPAQREVSAVLRQEGERFVETRTDTTTNLMSRHVQPIDEIYYEDVDVNLAILLPECSVSMPLYSSIVASAPSTIIDLTLKKSSQSSSRSRYLDVFPRAREKTGHMTASRSYSQGARRQSSVAKAKAGLRGTRNNKVSIQSLEVSSTKPCIRCSISHKKCFTSLGSQECARCRDQKYSMSTLPCLYFQITDITLFRTMTDPIYQKPYAILSLDYGITRAVHSLVKYSQSPTIEFEITQGFGTTLRLSAKSFDSTTIEDPASPSIRDLYSHAYALADPDNAAHEIQAFVLRSVVPYIRANVSMDDPLSWNIFDAACQGGSHGFLLDVLCLWTAARTIEGGWQFIGPETLGIKPKVGEAVRLTEAAFIDYQFSAIVAQDVLFPLRCKVLKQLHELTHSNTSANWFLRYTLMPLIKAIHLGAKTLLAHFHYICKGQKPFEVDWGQQPLSKAAQRMAKLSDGEVLLINLFSLLAKEKVPHFRQLMRTDEYESEYWFTGQLFVPDWRPPHTIEESPVA